MDSHRETVIAAVKTLPAWLAVGVGHIADNITLSGVASVVAIIYSLVQTYISIKRYRDGK